MTSKCPLEQPGWLIIYKQSTSIVLWIWVSLVNSIKFLLCFMNSVWSSLGSHFPYTHHNGEASRESSQVDQMSNFEGSLWIRCADPWDIYSTYIWAYARLRHIMQSSRECSKSWKLPHKSDSTFFFASSVLVFGHEQLPL